jgi:multidrug efflux pump subunit AcrA (membrane-fusion protein)
MATRDTDLSSLRIDRTPHDPRSPRKSKSIKKIVLWGSLVAALLVGFYMLRAWFSPAVEVQMVSASLTSPSQANAVLTASGYVVARRKAAVASKGTGRLVYLGVEEGDKVKRGQVIARLEDADVIAAREQARENVRLAEADLYEAKKNLERLATLVKQEMIAQAEYDVAEARYKRVIATIDVAKFAL